MNPSLENRVEFLFCAALELPESDRGFFLDEACGVHGELRSGVEQLLLLHEEATGFMPLEGPAGVELGTGMDHLGPHQEGGRIGSYKLLQRIGEGGCGVVWMAEQEEPVRRRVALKVIKLGMDTRSVIARFEAERQALALMEHPNIAKVLDAGATEAGRPYFVMELVRGIRITDYCDQNQLPTAARLALFSQVCQAIQHAHQKGIIHRDIKPSNILVTLHDGMAVPRVIDFGIAKATTGQRLTDKTLFTAFEQFIGTPAYMSPEQAEMSGLDIDTRSDIYSLGVLLYELLTGRTPFDARELMSLGLDAMRRIIREQEPVRPSTCLSTMLAADQTTVAKRHQSESAKLTHYLRGDLDWIVMKALEKDRTRRYETANAFASDIQRHLTNEPVEARPPSGTYRFRKFIRRNKIAFVTSSAILVALILGLGASTWMFFREREARGRAVAAEAAQNEERRKAEAEASKSGEVSRFLKDMLKGVGPAVALGRDTTLLREILEKTEERVGADLKDQPEVGAELRQTLGEVYSELGDYAKAEVMQREALALLTQRFGDDHPEVVLPLGLLGQALIFQEKFAEAEGVFRKQLELHKKFREPGHLYVAGAMGNLSTVLYGLGRHAEAETLGRESLGMHRRLLVHDHPDLAIAISNLAFRLTKGNKLEEAESLYRESLAIFKAIHGGEHPRVASSYHHLALLLEKRGRLTDAVSMQRDALRMQRKMLGNEHPEVASILNNLATMLVSQGNLEEAETLHREALGILQNFTSNNNSELDITLDHMTDVLNKQGKPAETEAIHREALALRKKLLGEDHPDVAKSLNNLARAVHAQGRLPEAETLFRELLARQTKQWGPEHTSIGVTLNELARVLGGQRRNAEAETLLRESLTMLKKFLGNEHGNVASTLSNLGGVLQDLGKMPEAETVLREAWNVRLKLLGPDHPDALATMGVLFQFLLDQQNFAGAAALSREALTLGVPTGEATGLGMVVNRLAEILYREGKFADAEPLYRELYERRRRHLSADADEMMLGTASLARVLTDWAWNEREPVPGAASQASVNAERAREAVSLLRGCLTTRQQGAAAGHWRTADVQSRLGGALVVAAATGFAPGSDAFQATLAEAESLLLKSHETLAQNSAVGGKYRRDALLRLVRLGTVQGRPEKAAAWQEKLDAFDKSQAQPEAAGKASSGTQ